MANGPAHYWRFRAQRYRLEGSRCGNCGRTFFPPRRGCTCATPTGADDNLLSGEDGGERCSYATPTTARAPFEHPLPFAIEMVTREREPSSSGLTLYVHQ